jgi:CRISPR-associated protein Cas1
MIKRTLFFGNNAYLSTKDKQLIIDFADESRERVSVPIEDVGVIVMEAYQMTISLNLISRLLNNNVALITCNEKKMPQGLMLNLDGNTLQQERFKEQINISLPLKKQLWQQTVKAKINNQAAILYKLTEGSEKGETFNNDFRNMAYWADSVRSGDPDNYEARAAAFYWANIFSEFVPDFVRGRFDAAPNNLLNYGYAVLRAVTARSLVASGLLPTLGIHHHNKYNAYALADDIMEPYRPYVDEIAYDILSMHDLDYDEENRPKLELTTGIKAELLKIPAIDVVIDNEKSPLMNAMQRTTASLFQCFAGNSRKVLYPGI